MIKGWFILQSVHLSVSHVATTSERIQKEGRKHADMTLWHHFVHISRHCVSIVHTLTDVNIWDYEGRWSRMGGSIKKTSTLQHQFRGLSKQPTSAKLVTKLLCLTFSLSHSTSSLWWCLAPVVAQTGRSNDWADICSSWYSSDCVITIRTLFAAVARCAINFLIDRWASALTQNLICFYQESY